MQAETELVATLCRMPISGAARSRARELVDLPLDWNAFFQRALEWEMEPVVMSNLRLHFADVIADNVMAIASTRERHSRAVALSRTLILIEVVKKLNNSGIDLIVLKGPATGVAAYGDPSFRFFSDIDLLVKRADIERARDVLITLGYSADYEPASEARLIGDQHALEFAGPSMKVELHCSLLSRHLRFEIDLDEIWESAPTVEFAGAHIKVLDRPHLFVFHCAHGTKHEWERPRWICDTAQLTERLDDQQVNRVLALAHRANGVRIVALALRVASAILGEIRTPLFSELEVPAAETAKIVDEVKARLWLDEIPQPSRDWLSRLDPRLRPLVFWARARERRIDQIACIARVLFVPTENDAGPAPLRWLQRPLRLAMRAARSAAHARTALI
jgi:hypothetical protein